MSDAKYILYKTLHQRLRHPTTGKVAGQRVAMVSLDDLEQLRDTLSGHAMLVYLRDIATNPTYSLIIRHKAVQAFIALGELKLVSILWDDTAGVVLSPLVQEMQELYTALTMEINETRIHPREGVLKNSGNEKCSRCHNDLDSGSSYCYGCDDMGTGG